MVSPEDQDVGSRLLPGDPCAFAGESGGLTRHGIAIRAQPASDEHLWGAELSHPRWGQAVLLAPREAMPLPEFLVLFDGRLTEEERETALKPQHALLLSVEPQLDDVLRDRKNLLRYLDAVLGDDGLVALDVNGYSVWSRGRLADELAHDAPLDIVHLHALHNVDMGDGVWLHSHGLAELGFVDYDILRPSDSLLGNQFDLLRALAFAVADGQSGLVHLAAPGGAVEFVDAATFMASASPEDRALREPEEHTERRVVCCEPRVEGFLARLFGRRRRQPSRLLSAGMQEGRQLLQFTHHATELTSTRARESVALFGRLREEFADLKLPALAKVGYEIDGAESPDDREHLWFGVHGLTTDRLDGTLTNQPHSIARLREGQRGEHDLAKLTDWVILTPVGPITPRSLENARRLRAQRSEIAAALAAAGGSWGE